MHPDFEPNEEYLVAYYRQYRKSNGSGIILQDLVSITVAVAFFALGQLKDDLIWSVIGFGIVIFLALRNLISGVRYNRILASIVEKYEEAWRADSEGRDAKQADPSDGGPPQL